MSEIEIITDGGRRRRWSAADKLRIVEETLYDSESISAVTRRNGVAPNLLYRWRKLMLEGGSIAVTGDDSVTSNKTVREMESNHPAEAAGAGFAYVSALGLRDRGAHFLASRSKRSMILSIPASSASKFPPDHRTMSSCCS